MLCVLIHLMLEFTYLMFINVGVRVDRVVVRVDRGTNVGVRVCFGLGASRSQR